MSVPPGYRHFQREETGSTNADCLEIARSGDPGYLWITAGRQTQGRGRSGRNWASEPGNLFASLLLVDPAPANALANLAFVAALSARDAIAAAALGTDRVLALKWPNDVLIDGRKVAGILLESAVVDASNAVVIGFGINCASHPADTRLPAIDLAACGIEVTPSELFGLLAAAFEQWLGRWDRGRGFAAIRQAWLAHADGIGSPIVARLPDREIRGTFAGIDESGYLILRRDGAAEMRIGAADIFP